MSTTRDPSFASSPNADWFDAPDPTGTTQSGENGLQFECTQCGNCCTGPSGYVLFTDQEATNMARTLGITSDAFYERFTRDTSEGRSLTERVTEHGYDCVFLDRDKHGRALCSVYNERPEQCRTWPFWKSNLRSKHTWKRASQFCPGMNKGTRYDPEYIRVTRDRVDI